MRTDTEPGLSELRAYLARLYAARGVERSLALAMAQRQLTVTVRDGLVWSACGIHIRPSLVSMDGARRALRGAVRTLTDAELANRAQERA